MPNETKGLNLSSWCSMLSTKGHGQCGGCDCTCHEEGAYGQTADRKREARLLGLVALD